MPRRTASVEDQPVEEPGVVVADSSPTVPETQDSGDGGAVAEQSVSDDHGPQHFSVLDYGKADCPWPGRYKLTRVTRERCLHRDTTHHDTIDELVQELQRRMTTGT